MKSLFTLFCIFFISVVVSQSLQNQVIGSIGGVTIQNNTTLRSSGGEVIAGVKSTANTTLEQGFLQRFENGIFWTGANGILWDNPASWNLNRVPNNTDHVIIPSARSELSLNVTLDTVANVTVKSGGTFIIFRKRSLVVTNNFENNGYVEIRSESDDSGVLIVKGESTGNIAYNRGGLLANQWSLAAPPVEGQKIVAFAQDNDNAIRTNTSVSPVRYAIAPYNNTGATDFWDYYDVNTDVNETFTIGTGYIFSRSSDGAIKFTGSLTTSDKNVDVVGNRWNAIGNPFTAYYPINKNSDISFLNDNASKLEIPAVYIWDKSQNKYTAITNLITSDQHYLPAGQGFFVKPNTNTSVFFDENKRLPTPTSGNFTFNKSATTPYIDVFIQKDDIKVKTSIIYSETATKGFDVNEDIENFGAANFDVNSHLVENSSGKNFTIQSVPKSDIENLTIPLHIKASKSNVVTFTLEKHDFPEAIYIYLEDKILDTFTKLDNENSSYQITLENDINAIGRFFIHTSTNVLSTENYTLNSLKIFKVDNKTIRVLGLQNQPTIIKIYDVLGKLVLFEKTEHQVEKDIDVSHLKNSIYLVNVENSFGKKHQKIVIE